VGYVNSAPQDAAFNRELECELERMREFLGLLTIEASLQTRLRRRV
jgi:hypothetical protein